ncbi:MAG: extensin family protein, partial [Pontixanthobacter sp.]
EIVHYGAYSCRRLYGRTEGRWSEHATGNAIDIAGFVLDDGTRVMVLDDWSGSSDRALFLKDVRDDACDVFGTVLSPDFNAAHRDHFHFDQAGQDWGVCR